jgi:hypothetical protein
VWHVIDPVKSGNGCWQSAGKLEDETKRSAIC